MKRLLKYLKPHKVASVLSLLLVLALIALDLYRPLIIGDAIDDYINSYYKPYAVVSQNATGKEDCTSEKEIYFDGRILKKDASIKDAEEYLQLYLYDNQYYRFYLSDLKESKFLEKCGEGKLTEEGLTIDYQGKKLIGYPLTQEDISVLRKGDFDGVDESAFRYLVVLFLRLIAAGISTWILQKMGQDIIYEMRNEVYGHIQSLDLNFFNNQPVGKLVTRVSNDTEAVNELFTTVLVKLFQNFVMIIGYGAVMLSINARMTGYAFLMLPIVGAVTFYFRYLSRKAHRMVRTAITDMNTYLSENLSGMKLIQIFNREKEKFQEFENKNQSLYKAHFREVMTFGIFRPAIYGLSVVALVLIMGYGSKFTLEGSISLGTLYVFINYIKSFFQPIQELAEQFGTLQSSIASSEKIFSVLDVEPTVLANENAKDLPELKGEIEFKNVWFAYEDDNYVLKDISFKIKPGEKVAFVGATGAGKSSILNLIGHYYDIQKGQILIDGVDIKDVTTDSLRSNIGQVQQDVFLFTGNIRNNITLENPDITEEEMKAAAKYVNAASFIEKLPEQYDEPVTERGSTLSAGQRQLISFARTLAYKPRILVLDEATANIDTETESLITDALQRLMEGRTTIMVAHRLSTIQHADKIMVMDKGEIKECGSHQELLAMNGIYRKLYDLQLATQE